jgi:hypothetical protein
MTSDDEVYLKPTRMRTHPHTTRSRLMLEVASELVNRRDWPYLQAKVSLREQGSDQWPVTLFGSDSPATIWEVTSRKVQFAIINPSMILKMAALGSPPFMEPLPLRSIAVLPSSDQMVFAVSEETELKSFTDIRERRFPLKVSLRGQPDHSLHIIIRFFPPRVFHSLILSRGAAKLNMTAECPTASIESAPCSAARFTPFSMKGPALGAIWRWNWE